MTQKTRLRVFVTEGPGTFALLCFHLRDVNSFDAEKGKALVSYASGRGRLLSTNGWMGRDVFRATVWERCWRSHVEMSKEWVDFRFKKVEKVDSRS